MLKRITAVLLIAAMLTLCSPAGALAAEGEVSLDDLKTTMDRIAESVNKISEITEANLVASTFQEFMTVVGYAGTALTAINGSVNFLKLIGVMEDPVSGGIKNILAQLNTVSETLNDIDNRLNDLASQMTEMQAAQEVNYRGTKALTLNGAWRDFEYRYMEEGMDEIMSTYEGMIVNGIKGWFNDASESGRKKNGIDNTKITVVYAKDSNGKESPLFFSGNSIPSEFKDCKYFTLSGDMLPGELTFNINSFREALADEIVSRMAGALEEGNYSLIESSGIPMLSGEEEFDADKAEALAKDAVSVLIYRVGCIEVNKDAGFVKEAERRFSNYCSHLLTADDGIDALLKTFYLTHVFEFEVSEQITDFLERMILKTGTYGTFMLNIEGMSDSSADSTKLDTAARFCDTVDALNTTLERALTGEKSYCYITNTCLQYTEGRSFVKATLYTKNVYNDTITYQGYDAEKIRIAITYPLSDKYSQIGDTNALILINTLKNNGLTDADLHDYLFANIGRHDYYVGWFLRNHGCILSSWGSEENMPLDGSIVMRPFNIIGNDFSGISSFKLTSDEDDYPDDADPDYIVHHKKLRGSLYNTSTGKLSANTVIYAVAVYGQNHSYWFKDEAAFFAGPSNQYNFDAYTINKQLNKFESADTLVGERWFNTLITLPIPERLTDVEGYDPLGALETLNEELEAGYPEIPDDPGEPTDDPEDPDKPISSDEPAPTPTDGPKSPETGDRSIVKVTAAMAIISLAVAAYVALKPEKKRR